MMLSIPMMTSISNPTGRAAHPVRIAMEQHDIDAVLREFAPGFALRSPVTETPFDGADSHRLLRVVLESYDRWECLSELSGDDECVLITRVQIGGRDVGIVDHMRHGPDGKVVDFAAYTRRNGRDRSRRRTEDRVAAQSTEVAARRGIDASSTDRHRIGRQAGLLLGGDAHASRLGDRGGSQGSA
jgi:hypothetical protein